MIDPEDQEWVNTDWLPRAIEAGYRKVAIIVPEDIFSQIAVDDIMEKAREEAPVEDHYFTNLEEAKAWLKA